MESINGYLITALLTILNLLVGLAIKNLADLRRDLTADIHDVREFTRSTRKKLDSHCENFQLHRVS